MATMSHELRTPLNAILGFSSILKEGNYGPINYQQKEFLEDIVSSGEHLKKLISSILDLSKIESGTFELNYEIFDIKNPIDEISTVVKNVLNKKELEFNVKWKGNNFKIKADYLRFKQIMFNLVENAIKFTDSGFIEVKIIEKQDEFEFQIEDTGIGIDVKDYNIIFREYGRPKNTLRKEMQGSGLGLAITKRLVNLHEGDIWFKSTKNKGSNFYFTIPKKLNLLR
jgi:signal transduction histidine kinase